MPDSPIVRHDPEPGEDYVQNRWWSIPGGCLLLIGLFVIASIGGLVLIQFSLTRSGAYRSAMERTRQNATAVSQLGSPIEPGWFTSGNVRVYGNSGDAQLIIPVSGPINRGTLFVVAHKEGAPWQFSSLQLAIPGRKDRIDLLQTTPEPPPSREF